MSDSQKASESQKLTTRRKDLVLEKLEGYRRKSRRRAEEAVVRESLRMSGGSDSPSADIDVDVDVVACLCADGGSETCARRVLDLAFPGESPHVLETKYYQVLLQFAVSNISNISSEEKKKDGTAEAAEAAEDKTEDTVLACTDAAGFWRVIRHFRSLQEKRDSSSGLRLLLRFTGGEYGSWSLSTEMTDALFDHGMQAVEIDAEDLNDEDQVPREAGTMWKCRSLLDKNGASSPISEFLDVLSCHTWAHMTPKPGVNKPKSAHINQTPPSSSGMPTTPSTATPPSEKKKEFSGFARGFLAGGGKKKKSTTAKRATTNGSSQSNYASAGTGTATAPGGTTEAVAAEETTATTKEGTKDTTTKEESSERTARLDRAEKMLYQMLPGGLSDCD